MFRGIICMATLVALLAHTGVGCAMSHTHLVQSSDGSCVVGVTHTHHHHGPHGHGPHGHDDGTAPEQPGHECDEPACNLMTAAKVLLPALLPSAGGWIRVSTARCAVAVCGRMLRRQFCAPDPPLSQQRLALSGVWLI